MPNLPTTTCTGCEACAQLCPVHAITMMASSEGFKYPQIDKAKCINCHLCEKRCPVLHTVALNDCNIAAYACINTDEYIRNESSSGGIFSLCTEHIINAGGVVFGARFSESFSVVHGFARTVEELSAFRDLNMFKVKSEMHIRSAKLFLIPGYRSYLQEHRVKSVG